VNATSTAPRITPVTWLRPAVDIAGAEDAARNLLHALGADMTDESLADTPGRVARMYAEMLTPEPFDLTTFPNDEGYDELVIARNIPFHSLCEHHLLPFSRHCARRLPPRRADPRTVQAGPRSRPVRGGPAGTRTTHQAGFRLAAIAPGASGCWRRARSRASVHEPARSLQAGRHDGYLRSPRPGSYRSAHAR